MNTKLKLNISIVSLSFAILITLYIQISVGFTGLTDYIKYLSYNKNDLRLNISLINPAVKSIAADPSNKLLLKVTVRDLNGNPVPMARVNLYIDNSAAKVKNLGELSTSDARTDKEGELIVSYSPPEAGKGLFDGKSDEVKIVALIKHTDIKISQSVKLVRTPVIFVHGYQAYAYVFENFGEYLKSEGFSCGAINYKSEKGVIDGAKSLSAYLQKQQLSYLSKGMQVQKFDIIAHSMGGLVARYYTCSEDYIRQNNVRKIIFISVPQKGSPWASLGAAYFKDAAIGDLIPENSLLSKVLPGMINKGLNSTIQIGSILGLYDEVVSQESAALDEWNICTELFSLGESNLNFNNLLKGNFNEATNHMSILSNKIVFQKVEDMLYEKLSYPAIRK